MPNDASVPPVPPREAWAGPTIVSFFAGKQYYYECGAALIQRCNELSLAHHVVEMPIPEGKIWADICRMKIPFLFDAWKKFQNQGILWIDVDTELLRAPDFLGQGIDFGGMLRGHKYLRGFDPLRMTRMFAPTYLYFGPTEEAGRFLEYMAGLEAEARDIAATDDYFLEEAWLKFQGQLNVQLFPPRIESIDGKGMKLNPYFGFGRSGSTPDFVSKVAQHQPQLYSKPRLLDTTKYLEKWATEREELSIASSLADLTQLLADQD